MAQKSITSLHCLNNKRGGRGRSILKIVVVVMLWRQVPGVLGSQLDTNMPIAIVMTMAPTKMTRTRRLIKARDPNPKAIHPRTRRERRIAIPITNNLNLLQSNLTLQRKML